MYIHIYNKLNIYYLRRENNLKIIKFAHTYIKINICVHGRSDRFLIHVCMYSFYFQYLAIVYMLRGVYKYLLPVICKHI